MATETSTPPTPAGIAVRTMTDTESKIAARAANHALAVELGLSGYQEFVALRDSIAKGATEPEFKAHLLLCKRLGLSPIGGQAHFVKRDTRVKENGAWVTKSVFTTQVGIDGYRALAEGTHEYEGPAGLPLFQYAPDEPWTEQMYVDKVPIAAKVGVYRKGWREPVYAVAMYDHYAQKRKFDDNGVTKEVPTQMWAKQPHPQLAKCAEALALRKGFPQTLGGVYTTDEMAQANPAINAVDAETIDVEPTVVQSNGQPATKSAPPVAAPAPKVDASAFPPPTEKELAWIKTLHSTLTADKQWAPGVRKDKMNRLGARGVMAELIKRHVALHGADDVHLSDAEMRKALGADPATGEVDRPLFPAEQRTVERAEKKAAEKPPMDPAQGDVDEDTIPF